MFNQLVKNKVKPWWKSKIAFLFSMAYLQFLLIDYPFEKAAFFLLIYLLSAIFTAIFAHLLNDWTDEKEDALASKFNSVTKLGRTKSLFFILISLMLAVVPWFFYEKNENVFYLLGLEFFLFYAYSSKIIRLKERKVWGVIVDSLYAYVIFSCIALSVGLEFPLTLSALFLYVMLIIWLLLVGIQHIVIHQIVDFQNDLKTGTKTWLTSLGKKRARNVFFLYLFPLQLVFFIIANILVAYKLQNEYILIFPVLLVGYKLYKMLSLKSYSNYLNSKFNDDLRYADIKYYTLLPYWFLCFLCLQNQLFWAFLIFHVFVFDFSFLIFLYKRLLLPLTKPISYLLNYSIYYFRRFVLLETIEKAMREYYPGYVKQKAQNQIEKKFPNIALLNINENKYTETFVLNHAISLRKEGYSVHELFGFPIPDNSKQKGILYSNNILRRHFSKFWNTLLFRRVNYQELEEFKLYILKYNIELVLAEFGTCGVEVFEICQELNIPLIVVFHGYDIHHKSVLDENKERYQALFSYASLLIGVSREIVKKLEALGAANKKTYYLPCSLNFELFTESYSPENDFTFLSVGRFTETKSPHLLILAFNEVLKMIPEAELRMIGKDGGGELFEACQILVKALGIEKKVAFLGVLPPEEVQWEMSRATVFVQHSLTTPINSDKEGTPVSVMEAMATGMPIVSTKHAGILDLIENEVNGILVDEYAYLEMAKQMIRLAQDKELRNFLGKNAANSIRNNALIMENSAILASLVEKYKLY